MSGGRLAPRRRRLPGDGELEQEIFAEADKATRGGAFRLVRRVLLSIVILLGTIAVAVSATLGIALYRHAHPDRVPSSETPASLFTKYEEVSFNASDGVALVGWWIPGQEGLPALILCHDLGESRASLIGLAARLAEERYPILVFDFRGHGGSGGTSSFGALEKRDLLGAVDWVASRTKADRIGVVGVGMGSYAAVLAAAERPQIRCLALDSPYPDAETEFAAAKIPGGLLHRWVKSWSGLIYGLAYRINPSEESAGRRVRELNDRDLLFLAPEGRESVGAAARAMYDSVGESRNNFKNLQILPATRTTTLYAQDRDRYDQALIGFFRSYLPPAQRVAGAPAAPPRPASPR